MGLKKIICAQAFDLRWHMSPFQGFNIMDFFKSPEGAKCISAGRGPAEYGKFISSTQFYVDGF